MTENSVYWNGSEFVINLPDDYRNLLHSVAEQMRSMIADNDPDTYRLFPPAYMHDILMQEEYRSYMGDELIKSHMAAMDVLQEMALCTTVHEDDLHSFMRAINQVRLVIGTRLDIEEETDVSDISPDSEDADLYWLYESMSFLLEDVVRALAGTVQDNQED